MVPDKQEKSKDILERAMTGGDRALWSRIGEQARIQIRMKRLAAWGMVSASLLLIFCVVTLVGLNGARAGRDGWLARIFTPLLEARIYSEPDPGTGFCPIRLDDGTWQQINDNTSEVLIPYLPMDLPEGYIFVSGRIRQPDRDTVDMTLKYEAAGGSFHIQYTYRYGHCPDIDTEGAREMEWDGTVLYLWEGPVNKTAWREEDIYTVISIEGDIDVGEMEEVYRCIQAYYMEDIT